MIEQSRYYCSSSAPERAVNPRPLLTELDLLRAQRIEMMGRLATCIAHDLSNTLSTMLMLMRTFPSEQMGPEHKNGFESSQICAERAARLVTQLLSLGRDVEEDRTSVNVGQLITETAGVLRSTFPKKINIHVTVAQDLLPITGNTTQLYQVLLNLCLNARDAMPSGGTLTIEASNAVLDARAVRSLHKALAGNYIVIRVTDTGPGIPPDIIGKVFEPFFTTKERDKGTGLGLFTVASIVKNHDGFVRLETAPKRGTRMIAYLPAAKVPNALKT